AAILGFIGIKLMIHAIHESPLDFIPGFSALEKIPEVPIWLSLTVIVVAMGAAVAASLLFPPRTAEKSDGGDSTSTEH
ncbi:MAG: TerC family protein, partial [Brachybacterium tyrofermentans]